MIEGRDQIWMRPASSHPRILLVKDIANDVRDEDKVEWETASGMPLMDALWTSLRSDSAWVAGDFTPWGYRALAAGGATPSILRGVGNAWMILTKEGASRPHRLQRNFFIFLRSLLGTYPTLHAWADARNIMHHEWMLKCGFTQTDAVVTIGGFPFILFTYSKDK